jgi:hypothetical protein
MRGRVASGVFRGAIWLVAGAFGASAAAGCFRFAPSKGGGQVGELRGRRIDARDVAVPDGYVVDVVAAGLTFPTSIAFDERNTPYVIEAGYSYGERFGVPRLLRITEGRAPEVVLMGSNGPWTGIVFHEGRFFVAEGGQTEGGRIVSFGVDGKRQVLVENLPSFGDHHTNGPAIGADGFVYFGQGTMTNSGVVGEDNAQFGWLHRHPERHDIPCQDVTLTGANFSSEHALEPKKGEVKTGAFMPYASPSTPRQVVRGSLPCSGAILRVPIAGGPLELVAWGFRNPFGLAFSPKGQLYVTENGFDVRGSRPVFGAADLLWRITPGTWYGWPDYSEGRRVDTDEFDAPNNPRPPRLLAVHPNQPPMPAARFAVHSSSNGFDFSRSTGFGFAGQAFVAQFGDQAPAVGKTLNPVGFKVVRVDPDTGVIHDFAVNPGSQNGPASLLRSGGLERPIAARFDRTGDALYIVDFGVLAMEGPESKPLEGTGVVWRIRRSPRS